MAAAVAWNTSPRSGGADRAPAVAAADAIERSVTRLCWQRIELGPAPGGHRARVMGIRHRRPVTVAVSLEVAAVLRQRGLRTVIRRVEA